MVPMPATAPTIAPKAIATAWSGAMPSSASCVGVEDTSGVEVPSTNSSLVVDSSSAKSGSKASVVLAIVVLIVVLLLDDMGVVVMVVAWGLLTSTSTLVSTPNASDKLPDVAISWILVASDWSSAKLLTEKDAPLGSASVSFAASSSSAPSTPSSESFVGKSKYSLGMGSGFSSLMCTTISVPPEDRRRRPPWAATSARD
mmetsp:Transcript_66856/g.204722  ORF Transcript_66856/g.204722 Transcript_66856/m.204722 type:complete len:200 (-) Transcript_66856:2436-3035(-)